MSAVARWLGLGVLAGCTALALAGHSSSTVPPPPVAVRDDPTPAPLTAVPRPRLPAHGRRIVIAADGDDQCYIDVAVGLASNDRLVTLRALLDSGAAPRLTLGTKAYAELGGDVSELNYDRRVSTANGLGRAAAIEIRELRIGTGVVVRDIAGLVNENGPDVALLGAPLLRRLHYQLADGTCVLTSVARSAQR